MRAAAAPSGVPGAWPPVHLPLDLGLLWVRNGREGGGATDERPSRQSGKKKQIVNKKKTKNNNKKAEKYIYISYIISKSFLKDKNDPMRYFFRAYSSLEMIKSFDWPT